MKQVSFKVAKALKEAGYPQDVEFWKHLEDNTYWYFQDGMLEKKGNISDYVDVRRLIFAPTYLEAWLWLWREKQFDISVCFFASKVNGGWYCDNKSKGYTFPRKENDPEEVIVSAIDSLVELNLIK